MPQHEPQPASHPALADPLALLDAVPVLIAYVDTDGRYRFVNRAYADWFGKPELALVGRTFDEVMGDSQASTIAPHVSRALAGETVTWARWCRTPAGEPRYLQATYVPQRDPAGAIIGLVATIIDITDRRRAEEKSELRTRTLGLLYDAADGLLRSQEPQRLLDALFDRLSEHLGLELYFHYRADLPAQILRMVSCRGIDPAAAASIRNLHFGEAVCGAAAASARPVIVHQVDETNEARTALIRRLGITAYACHPLLADGKLLGTLSFGTRRKSSFDAEEIALLRAVCDQIAVAIDRHATDQALRNSEGRLRFLDTLGAVTRDLAEPEAVMAAVTRHLGQHLRVSRCAYADVDPDANRFVIRHDYTDNCPSTVGNYSLDLFGPRAAADQRAGRTLVLADVDRELSDADGAAMFRAIGIRAIICCPLIKNGRLAAMMAVHSAAPRDWSPAEVRLVEDVVERSWAFVERARADREQRQAKEAAEAANRAKDQFLAVLSHELRTPLTPVAMTVSALETDPALPPHLRDEVAMIRRNISLESKLIDDLLDLSRVTTGKLRLNPRPTDLHDLARHVLDNCRPDAAEKHLHLHTAFHATRSWVTGDPARLQQVLWNLLRNAIKFTPEGKSVLLRTLDVDGHIRLEVVDEGVGIAPEFLPKIFDAFEQGDSRAGRSFGGLGLGLAIARTVAELHGGRLWAHSAGPGLGATFTLELNSTHPAHAHPGPPASRPATQPPRPSARILLVEDHPDTSRTMRRLLSAAGYTVSAAATVADALRLAADAPFDLIISDIGLPDGTGYDFLQQLKARHPSAAPAIALSGYGMEEDVRRSAAAGFAMHLTKPIDIAILEQALASLANP